MAISGFAKQMFTIMAIKISVSEAGLIALQEASNLTLADCKGDKVATCQTATDPPVACTEKYVETVPGAEGIQCGGSDGGCLATGPDGCSGANCFCALSATGPKSCLELFEQGKKTDGVYEIQPGQRKIKVFCDMTRDGGGWTLVAKIKRGNKKGDPRKKQDAAWCANQGTEGKCSEFTADSQAKEWLQNDNWPNTNLMGMLAWDDWNAIFRSGKNYFRRDASHNNPQNYFKRVTDPSTFDMVRAYFQWDYKLGTSGVDFNLVDRYDQIDTLAGHSCNYACYAKERHYVGFDRDCAGSGHWDAGTWSTDCIGDEADSGGYANCNGPHKVEKKCADNSNYNYDRILWVK